MASIQPTQTTGVRRFKFPESFAWHQSSVATMLRCPRRFRFRYIDKVPLNHEASNYAAPLGTADHCGIEHILKLSNEGRRTTRGELLDVVMAGFSAALIRSQDNGEHSNPDDLPRVFERIEGERMHRLELLADDPRIHAIDWRGIEWKFKFEEQANARKWQGTLDAWGIAKRDVYEFGKEGRDVVGVAQGEPILVDWKTGLCPPFGWAARRNQVQLGIYAMALNRSNPRPWRTFLGITQDLDRPKVIQGTPKMLPKAISPAYVEAIGETGSSPEVNALRAAASKKRPRGIKKWLPEELNPDWVAATSKPKGPFFREARVSFSSVLATTRDAIRQAELGLFPASGALTDQCGMCPYQQACTTTNEGNH